VLSVEVFTRYNWYRKMRKWIVVVSGSTYEVEAKKRYSALVIGCGLFKSEHPESERSVSFFINSGVASCRVAEKLTGRFVRALLSERKKLTNNGYVFVHAPKHPRSNEHGYVPEHILVWEKAHGTQLPGHWVVHHLNGDRGDNRPENLLALPRSGHHGELVNQALKQRIRDLELRLENEMR